MYLTSLGIKRSTTKECLSRSPSKPRRRKCKFASTPPQVEVSSALLTESQIAQIQSIITRTVEQSVSKIASNAARAAVQAMANSTPINARENTVVVHDESEEVTVNPSSNTTSTNALTFGSNQAANSVAYGNGFHEVPAQYINKFNRVFDLSKLLPKNMSTNNHSDEPMILTLENLVIKVKKASQPTSRITDIE